MNRSRVMIMPIVISVALAVGTVWADSTKDKLQMSQNAKITIDQAIKSATERVPGKVIEAELEKKHDRTVWEVEVVSADNKIAEVHVDAMSGAIIDVEMKDKKN
ncbi:MAG TPA: PepSY domain-containing protein [Nitrospira sp.]|nr:PepSY domain-containing protein [Nitrospira sp.]